MIAQVWQLVADYKLKLMDLPNDDMMRFRLVMVLKRQRTPPMTRTTNLLVEFYFFCNAGLKTTTYFIKFQKNFMFCCSKIICGLLLNFFIYLHELLLV